MCKVLIIPRIQDDKRDLILEFVDRMAVVMSKSNSDGLGYAAVDSDGKLFGERWLTNSDFYNRNVEIPENNMIKTLFGEVIDNRTYMNEYYGDKTKGEYNSFGDADLNKAAALTLHTRMATSGKGHQNTHPFYDKEADSSLIHNGVISNVQDFKFKLSSCDSEAILISYLDNKVYKTPERVEEMASDLVGYYVAAVFSRDPEGNRILDIMKAHNSALSACWVPEFNTYVMASSNFDLANVLNEMGLVRVGLTDFKDGVMMRIDPISGDVLLQSSFTVGKRTEYTRPVESYNSRTNNVTNLPTRQTAMGKGLSKELMEYFQLSPSLETLPASELGNTAGYTGE